MGHWGPWYWRFIHYFSIHDAGRELLQTLQLPCYGCKGRYVGPTDEENLAEWSLTTHNTESERKGPGTIWNMDQLLAEYSECKHENWSMDRFPWNFMFHHAGVTNDIPYLQEVGRQYPCSKCKLITLDPLPDEDAYTWLKRNWELAKTLN